MKKKKKKTQLVILIWNISDSVALGINRKFRDLPKHNYSLKIKKLALNL